MSIQPKSKSIKKRTKKNKKTFQTDNVKSEPKTIVVSKTKAVKKFTKSKEKSAESKPFGENFDLDAVDVQLSKLRDSEDSSSKKIRKKIRQLEFLKKKYTQLQNTKDSLKLDGEKETEESAIDMDDELPKNNAISEKLIKEKVKEESMKGIKRFVVFVGNLPKSVTEDDLKNHFLKVGNIKSVRIPDAKESRKSGFAFLELEDNVAFEKTLSMHHTMINNRRINVLYTNPDGKNLDKKEIKKKNAKFDAMRKAGILAGSVAQNKKRSFRRKKKRLAEEKAANK